MVEINKIYVDEAASFMNKMDVESVDLTITSPPYDNLRNYNGYDFDFEKIADGLLRVTKEGGIVVWVTGDSIIKGSESLTSFKHALYFKQIGFNVHDTMIYEKNGAAYPANAKSNRYSQIFEYMFIFSKGKPKTHNLIKDKSNKWAGSQNFGKRSSRLQDGSIIVREKGTVPDFSYRNNIWRINNGFGYTTKDKYAYEHPAMFPEQLANDHIITWSNEGDLVFDPMVGAGTTCKMAKLNNRNFLGCDISENYVNIANKRIQ